MLWRDADKRLGAGLLGWEEIRSSKFFASGHSKAKGLFSKLWDRELKPPFVPDQEEYIKEADMKDITDSDSEEFASNAINTSIGDIVLQAFRNFDMKSDGSIDRTDLQYVLQMIDPVTFTDATIRVMLQAVDKHGNGCINFKEFCDWLFTDEASHFRGAVAA